MKNFLTFIFSLIFIANVARGATVNSIDLIWEGETYVPAFYAGRPLPTGGNLVQVVAMPNVIVNGQPLVTSQLVFHWVKDFNPIQSASGLGKNALEYRADQGGGSSIVSVEILTTQGERLAEGRVTITPTSPKIVLYRITPLINPSRARSLTGVVPISSTETTLIAEPFFFSPLDLANRRLTFDWRINGANAPASGEDARRFTVAAPSQGSGQVGLTVTVRSETSPLQTASQKITLGFGLQDFTF